MSGASREVGSGRYVRSVPGQVPREPVSAGSIRSAGYNQYHKILDVEFTNRYVYRYTGVEPAVYGRFRTAASPDRFFVGRVRDKYPVRLVYRPRASEQHARESFAAGREPEIRLLGVASLNLLPLQELLLGGLITRGARRICRHVAAGCSITVHFKAYETAGKRRKYSVHVRLAAPGVFLASSKAHDWDVRRAVHAAFDGLETRLAERRGKRWLSSQESSRLRRDARSMLTQEQG